MTIKDFLKHYAALTRPEAEAVISCVLKKPREFVLAHPQHAISAKEAKKAAGLAKRRLAGEPLAYLLGHKEFYGLDFLVNRHTLIPRPETELMVEEALAILKKKNDLTLIDVGTGSGCIAITIAKELEKICHSRAGGNPSSCPRNLDSRLRGNDRLVAIDLSKRALATARKNAQLNGVDGEIEFIHGNLLKPIINSDQMLHDVTCYMICANLPYLTPEQVRTSPTIKHEPRSALISGQDGLQHYRQLFRQIKKLKFTDCATLCEIDDTQGAGMAELIKQELPRARFEIKKDLSGYDRLAIIVLG